MGQGAVAIAADGRAAQFVPTDIGGRAPGALDPSTMGNPAKFAYCFAENFKANPAPHRWARRHPASAYIGKAQMALYRERVPERPVDSDGKDGLQLVIGPEELMVMVAGEAGRHSCVIPSFGSTLSVTEPVT